MHCAELPKRLLKPGNARGALGGWEGTIEVYLCTKNKGKEESQILTRRLPAYPLSGKGEEGGKGNNTFSPHKPPTCASTSPPRPEEPGTGLCYPRDYRQSQY